MPGIWLAEKYDATVMVDDYPAFSVHEARIA